MESDILRQHSLALSPWPPKYLSNSTNTNQTITLKRRCPIVKFERAGNITEITMPDKQNNKSPNVDLEQAHAPGEFKPEIDKLLKKK